MRLFSLKRSIALLLVLLLPISVSAGLVETLNLVFSKSFSGESLLANESKNIQNMALLVAAGSPYSDGSGESAPAVDKNALVSDIGPAGTSAEAAASKPSSDQISIYVVREGDTLSQIAEMFDVTVNTIKWSNDLSSNTLKQGQTLVILPISGVKHVVAKGDTLDSIAKKYKGDVEEIIAYNNLSKGSSLAVGSTIIVPDGEAVPESSSRSSVVPPTSGKEYVGFYLRPVAGIKTQGIHGSNGIDIGAPIGTSILASAGGEVIVSRTGGWNGGYGNYIVIKHSNGTQTLYAHNSRNFVSVGDMVEKGEVIGAVGSTGKSTGPHLHFEIRGAKNPF